MNRAERPEGYGANPFLTRFEIAYPSSRLRTHHQAHVDAQLERIQTARMFANEEQKKVLDDLFNRWRKVRIRRAVEE